MPTPAKGGLLLTLLLLAALDAVILCEGRPWSSTETAGGGLRQTTTDTPSDVLATVSGGTALLSRLPVEARRQLLGPSSTSSSGKVVTVENNCTKEIKVAIAYPFDHSLYGTSCHYTFVAPGQTDGVSNCEEGPFSLSPGQSSSLGSYPPLGGYGVYQVFVSAMESGTPTVVPEQYGVSVPSKEDGNTCKLGEAGCYYWFSVDTNAPVVMNCMNTNPGKSGTPIGAIVGGVVGGLAALASLSVYCVRKRRQARKIKAGQEGKGAAGSLLATPVPGSPAGYSAAGSGYPPAGYSPGYLYTDDMGGLPTSTTAAPVIGPLARGAHACLDSVLGTYPTRPPGLAPVLGTQTLMATEAEAEAEAGWAGAVVVMEEVEGEEGEEQEARPAGYEEGSQEMQGPDDIQVQGSAPSAPSMPQHYMGTTSGEQSWGSDSAGAAAAATGAAAGTASGNSAMLRRDEFLNYIHSQLPPMSPTTSGGTTGSGGSAGRRTAASSASASGFEVSFQDIQIVKPIGEGSFGRAYLARWHHTTVACKILINRESIHQRDEGGNNPPLELPPALLAKLDEEAGLMTTMRHPNIVNFYGVCHLPPCILTEYCSRGSLSDLLAQAREEPRLAAKLTWQRRLAMALDAALGMLYLHTRPSPIIHRDLKSPNLLVDDSWRVKVSDFNLSRMLEDATRSTSMAATNPRWLAPEVMRGDKASRASDVYSFGIVMWELLTWQLPWAHVASSWQLVNQLTSGARLEVPPRKQLPGVELPDAASLDAYVALMRRCWAEEQGLRPTFEEVTTELRSLVEQSQGAEGSPL